MASQPLRAGVYGRESRDKTKSIDDQVAIGVQTVEETEGWTLAGVYSDGESASRFARRQREDWPRLLADLTGHRLDVLVLWEMTRGVRQLAETAVLLDTCRDNGVLIYVVSDERLYDPRRARDYKDLASAGVDGAYETDRLSERSRRGTRAAAQAGKPHGPVLYGYRRLYDPESGEYVRTEVDPERARIVEECVRRVAAGERLYAIAKDLDSRGIAPPRGLGRWQPTQIRRFAENPGYVGLRHHRGEVVGRADWPAIVDEEVWRRANAAVTARVRTSSAAPRWLLNGALRCSRCGSMSWSITLNRGSYRAYNCRRCHRMSIAAHPADAYVQGLVAEWLERHAASLWRATDDDAGRKAWQQVDELQARLDAFTDRAADGEISDARLARIEARLVPQIEDASRRARAASAPAAVSRLDPEAPARHWLRLARGEDVPAARAVLLGVVDLELRPAPRQTRVCYPSERIAHRWLR